MRYELTNLPQEQFNELNDIVRLALFRKNYRELRSIQETLETLETHHQRAFKEQYSGLLVDGMTFHVDSNTFDIWIRPDLDNFGLEFPVTLTVMHELCHGYLGWGTGFASHRGSWRKLFGRSVLLYNTLVKPIYVEDWIIKRTLRRYISEMHPEAPYGAIQSWTDRETEDIFNTTETFLIKLVKEQKCPKFTFDSTLIPDSLASLQQKVGTELQSI